MRYHYTGDQDFGCETVLNDGKIQGVSIVVYV